MDLAAQGVTKMVGQEFYNGVITAQRVEAFDVLRDIIFSTKPEIIIELGTYHGGLSLFLSELNFCDVHTFDIIDHNPNLPKNTRLIRNFINVFLDECKNKIKKLTEGRKTLWLFDGGDKKKEVLYYKDICKPGEIIMVHDFAPDQSSFDYLNSNGIWHWWESDATSFDPSEFKQHDKFDFIWKTCVWGTYVKLKSPELIKDEVSFDEEGD